ncbi:MAG: MMPL family transporter [Cytophagales bacterium]|jgi:predicted RND superfamily exporter protein|nr:MMPL family transporter [Cytophagales bacterium]MCA6388931.1 MMPL family transporter [Cytophagales bacterium]MCA6391161.1 MMPL family transporter [Cytophagales bacterium]MCA6395848.1 MMPL family transporter [Cytophagales bacterium]MCA6397694.1 MMPL family transporter [Cytophagales bacterium]
MWTRIAQFIIKFRLTLIGIILLITVFMGYHATKVQMSYDLARTVPLDDPEMVFLQKFKAQFGEDGNIIAVGLRDSAIYTLNNFNRFRELNKAIREIPGVNNLLSLPEVKIIRKDTANTRFYLDGHYPKQIKDQAQLDSLMGAIRNQKFYMGQIVNQENGATMMLVSITKEVMNSSKRIAMTKALVELGDQFTKDTGIQLRYAGLPFIRAMMATEVRREMQIFLYLSALVTGIIMFFFFRSFRAVLFSMIIIGIVVVWVMGTLALFGYKITLLSGLIPPVIVTIGITNAIYLLNKYHLEFAKRRDKEEAIAAVVNKMGLAMFLTNLTVAIGFLTLLTTDILVLREFGIVAGINIMALFVVSLIMIPGIFSWLPEPTPKHLRHLNFKILGSFLFYVDIIVHRYRPAIYFTSLAITIVAAFGMLRLESISFMMDDVPEGSQIKKDLQFFESNFSGILPLEIEVNTGKRRGVLNIKNLEKIDEFESFIDSISVVSRPVSVISLVKASKQAFYNYNPAKYALPSKAESGYILRYMKGQTDNTGLLKSFVDSTFTKMRISMQIADIGSKRLDSLVHEVIEPRMNQIFEGTNIQTSVTGTTKLFIKGNKFLIDNLKESLLLAFILITLSMAMLFSNVRMIIISLVPNVIALMITAGIMGYLGIPLKPSTALIFSITFGISVDNSIRFLAKYRQEQLANGFFVPVSVSESIMETGKSIIYTSIVLFAGFILFAFSSFGGTIALGVLTSTTLVISMFTNLILLPALIMTFDKPKKSKGEKLLIDDFDPGFYGEEEDEAIDLSKIKIHDRVGSAE